MKASDRDIQRFLDVIKKYDCRVRIRNTFVIKLISGYQYLQKKEFSYIDLPDGHSIRFTRDTSRWAFRTARELIEVDIQWSLP